MALDSKNDIKYKNSVSMLIFLGEYDKFFVSQKEKAHSYGVPCIFYNWARSCHQMVRVLYNMLSYAMANVNREYSIVCCDKRKAAQHLIDWFGIDNVILLDDVTIKNSTVQELNKKYREHLFFIKDTLGGSELLHGFFEKMDIPENSNIFLTIGEYELITDFELALEAFCMLVNHEIDDISLKKITFMVVVGDELHFNSQQQNYFKKLEGLIRKCGLNDNVFFLTINPFVSKEMLMKSSLAIIFTNKYGCYKKNLKEALNTGKHMIVPDTRFYRNYLTNRRENCNILHSPEPTAYAKEMNKLVKSKVLFKILAMHSGVEVKK